MEAAGEDVRTDVVSEVACHLDELPQEILFLILTHLRDVKEVASGTQPTLMLLIV